MQTYYTEDGQVVLEVDDQALYMTRGEAEGLFVMLGHTLHDMDVSMDNYSEDKGEQP